MILGPHMEDVVQVSDAGRNVNSKCFAKIVYRQLEVEVILVPVAIMLMGVSGDDRKRGVPVNVRDRPVRSI
jgi:hypothetical protein